MALEAVEKIVMYREKVNLEINSFFNRILNSKLVNFTNCFYIVFRENNKRELSTLK